MLNRFLLVVFTVLFQEKCPDGIFRILRDDGAVIETYRDFNDESGESQKVITIQTKKKKFVKYKTGVPWLKFRHDLLNTGYTFALAPDTLYLNWKTAPLLDVVSSPAVADSMVFFGTFGSPGWVVCVNQYTGQEIWHFIPPHLDYVNSSPAVNYGRVYIGDRNGFMWCLDEYNGDTLWSYHANNGIDGGIAVDDSLVFFGSMRGGTSPPYSIYALNAFTGDLVWGVDAGGAMVGSTPAVTESLVVVGSDEGDNNVYCLEKQTGNIVWLFAETTPPGWVDSSPCIYDGKVYVGSTSGKVYCLNLTDGSKIWEFNVGTGIWITSSPGAHNGKIFIGAYNGNLYALPALDPDSNGIIEPSEVLWTFTTGDLIGQSSPAIAGGMVFIGSYDSTIYALDEETGNLLWSYKTGAPVLSSPAISDGMVFIGSADDTLYAFGEPVQVRENSYHENPQYLLNISPNPFIYSTSIIYHLPYAQKVSLKIYDISGNLVSSLISQHQARGLHKIYFNTEHLSGGIYFCYLRTQSGFIKTEKFVHIKN